VRSGPDRGAHLADLTAVLGDIVGVEHVRSGDSVADDYAHDEALRAAPRRPAVVVHPSSSEQVSGILRVAHERRVSVTARGSGTGLSGGAIARSDGILVSFERMDRILEIDTANHVAVVQPGVTLERLDEAAAPHGLMYPVYPGEYSATLGGNVATNAGGMTAVKYGVTRHQVLGIEAVLATGDVIRAGGKFVKATSGYDLTQLVVGSEGTLALVTEAILRLHPTLEHQATVLAPFPSLEEVTAAVPSIVASGIGPKILEYIDTVTMAATTAHVGLDLGIPSDVEERALAYLVAVLESTHADRLDEDVQTLGARLTDLGAIDVYVLPPHVATRLIDAREKAFWVAKANDADDIVDVVVPRAAVPDLMATVTELGQAHGAWIVGCGHAGDGNVHLSVFQTDDDAREKVMRELFEAGLALGGAISGEHGIGTEKRRHFLALEDPAKLALMRRIKQAFDPHGILNPDVLLGPADGDGDGGTS
jgi:glycolate oxidase